MSSAIQTAVEVFTSEVRPILEKWGYSIYTTVDEPDEVWWEIRWGNWKDRVRVKLKSFLNPVLGLPATYLEIRGGFYRRTLYDPHQISKDITLRRLESAVEAAIVSLSRGELREVYYPSGVLQDLWCMTRHTTWVTLSSCRYRCTLKISLSKRRPSWRWVCEFAELFKPLRKLCDLKPTEEVINPTEAFVKFSRMTIVEALL